MYNPFDHYWRVGGDSAQVYSSARGQFVPTDDGTFVQWQTLPDNFVTPIDSMDSLKAVLRTANVPPFHRVAKSTIISRLTDELLSAAYNALNSNLRLRERWYAPDQGYINADDPDAASLLEAIGADVALILAPD